MKDFVAVIIACVSLAWAVHPATAQIAAGQLDDFQQGGTQGWQEGSSPNPPQLVVTGGPNGDGDAFLRNQSSGINGPGGRMTVFNTQPKWRGNYLNAGIAALEVDLNNLGSTPLTMRFDLVRMDPMNNMEHVFTQGFDIQPGGGWQHATFSLATDDLISAGNMAAILSNVMQLRLIHEPGSSPSHPGTPVNAVLGIDNIRAVGPPVEMLPGDYNGNGTVEQADLDLVLLNWGGAGDPAPSGWVNDLPMGTIDQAELDGVLLNWGSAIEAASAPAAMGGLIAIPEPSALLMLVVCGFLFRPFLAAQDASR